MPALPQAHGSLVEWIIPVVRTRFGTEREIDHPDGVDLLVVEDPVHAADDIGVATSTVLVEGLDRDNLCIGRDAIIFAVPTAGVIAINDDAAHVTAVSVLIERLALVILDGIVNRKLAFLVVDSPVGLRLEQESTIQYRDGHPRAVDPFGMETIRFHQCREVNVR